MTSLIRVSACLLVAFALVGCNQSGPAVPATTTEAPADAATVPAASSETATPAAADDAPITLTMDKAKAYAQALKNLAKAQEADPGLDTAQNMSEEDVGQYAARLQASPKMRAAIEAAGLSTRDFARIGESLLSALMAQGAVEAGHLDAVPEGIDPAAIAFVKQHKAELAALLGLRG